MLIDGNTMIRVTREDVADQHILRAEEIHAITPAGGAEPAVVVDCDVVGVAN